MFSMRAGAAAFTSGFVPATLNVSLRAKFSRSELVARVTPTHACVCEYPSFLDADAGRLDPRTPFLGLGLDVSAERLRRRAADEQAEILEPALHRRVGDCRVHVGVDLRDDLSRRLRRHEDRVPAGHVEAGQAGLRD